MCSVGLAERDEERAALFLDPLELSQYAEKLGAFRQAKFLAYTTQSVRRRALAK